MARTTKPLEHYAKKRINRKITKDDRSLLMLKRKIAQKKDAIAEAEREKERIAAQETAQLLAKEAANKEAESSPYVKYKQYAKYQNDPVGFIENELGINLWDGQTEIAKRLNVAPYRLAVAASHSVGKSYLSACLAIWFLFSFPDSIVISLAPTQRQVEDVLWAQIRALNTIDPTIMRGTTKAAAMINSRWFARGFAPSSGDSLQGLHPDSGNMLIIFDEAVGIDSAIFEATNGLDNERVRWLCIFNPTSVDSQMYREWLSGSWDKINVSGLDHPNVRAWLKGEPEPFPGAIHGAHWDELFRKWSDPVDKAFKKDTDIEYPPDSGEYWRPGALAMARLLGEWPITSGDCFFSTTHVDRFLRRAFTHDLIHGKKMEQVERAHPYQFPNELQVGVDVARSGKDFSCICVRYRKEIVQHHRINGYDTTELASFIIEVLDNLELVYDIDAQDIHVAIDSTGLGVGVYDVLHSQYYNVYDVHFSHRAHDTQKYANTRTELIADLADLCKNFHISLATELLDDYGYLIEKQMLGGALYKFNAKGLFILIPKDNIRKSLGMSPDDLDAIALACRETEGRLTVFVADY